jgi:hypothetical protein
VSAFGGSYIQFSTVDRKREMKTEYRESLTPAVETGSTTGIRLMVITASEA